MQAKIPDRSDAGRKRGPPGFAGNARPHLRNPMVELPVPVAALLAVDAVIITHTHMDHWDEAAQQLVPKTMMIYSQNETDAALIRSQGFENVRVLQDENPFVDGLTIYKTDGQHGCNALYADKVMGDILGDACGWYLPIRQKKPSTLLAIPYGLSPMSERCNVFSRR